MDGCIYLHSYTFTRTCVTIPQGGLIRTRSGWNEVANPLKLIWSQVGLIWENLFFAASVFPPTLSSCTFWSWIHKQHTVNTSVPAASSLPKLGIEWCRAKRATAHRLSFSDGSIKRRLEGWKRRLYISVCIVLFSSQRLLLQHRHKLRHKTASNSVKMNNKNNGNCAIFYSRLYPELKAILFNK